MVRKTGMDVKSTSRWETQLHNQAAEHAQTVQGRLKVVHRRLEGLQRGRHSVHRHCWSICETKESQYTSATKDLRERRSPYKAKVEEKLPELKRRADNERNKHKQEAAAAAAQLSK